jgi:hypothetical protein
MSCTNKIVPYATENQSELSTIAPSYNNLNYWAAHPWKKDAADSIPAPLKNEQRDTLADVFFIHPTTYTKARTDWNADVDDEALNTKTDQSSILYQATVFNQHSRVFAPRYRQAHISAFFTKDTAAQQAFDVAYEDIKAAFEYYLANYNNNRPIIIAGHSQGCKMAAQLLKDYFENKPLQKQLVAAYLIGLPIAKGYFEILPPCNNATQTGCFTTWRTFRKGYLPTYVTKEDPQAIVTNPLNWKTDETYATKNQNKGSVLKNFNKVYKRTTDAQVHSGILWVSKPAFPGGALLRIRNYHIADINLFYINIRQNIEERVYQYMQQQTVKP